MSACDPVRVNPGAAHVLVVDDDPIVRDVLLRYLSRDGLSAEAAGDGISAVAAFEARRPELVVLDLMLPRLDGFEVFRRIRGTDPQAAVLMLTARGQETDRVVGLDSGADDYVTKPCSPREIVARVKAILRRTGDAGLDHEPERQPSAALRSARDRSRRARGHPRRLAAGADAEGVRPRCTSSPPTRGSSSAGSSSSTGSGTPPTTATRRRSPSTCAACGRRSSPTRPTRGGW